MNLTAEQSANRPENGYQLHSNAIGFWRPSGRVPCTTLPSSTDATLTDHHAMLLPHDDAMQFIEAYKAVLTQVLINEGKKLTRSLIKDLAKARNLVKADLGRLHRAMAMVKSTGDGLVPQIESALPTMRAGRWFYLRSTTRYALMLDADLKNAYAVKGLTTPLHELLGGTAVVVETAIFEYKGEFVCDGIIADPVYIGPGIRADLNATYATIKAEGRFHKRCAG